MKTWTTSEQLQAANGSEMKVEAKGVLRIKTHNGDLIIKDSLLVPSATLTLVAMGPFLQKGAVLRGHSEGANLFDKDGKLILETQLLGHPGNDLASRIVPGVDFSLLDCTSCSLAKAHRLPFQGKFPDAFFPLDIVHMDICGPIIPATWAGNRYIFQIIDGFSRMRFTFPLKRKSDSLESFITFKRFGINHLLTAPFTPQQNPIAERGNRTLLEKIRVLLANYQVPTDWWGEACSMATYLLNRTPVSTIGFQAPILMHIPRAKRMSKVKPTGSLCMFLGVSEHHHNFRLFDPKSKRIVITHDCTFKDGEAFWPTHFSVSTPSPLLSFPDSLLCPSNSTIKPASGFSDVAAVPVIINNEEPVATEEYPQVSSSENSLVNKLAEEPVPSSETTLPKGWVYDDVPCKAPQDISGAISPENIINDCRVRRPPTCFVGAVLNKAPRNFPDAMASSKAANWLAAIGKEFESLE
ncbi:hypothetical protein O181_003117 [Austropuccinia psidii MF-1]|uniref:Integrase catalytic domain-containing protein n=1 Tax=Austropuccinia psidii MF-1 TaxID=1389203 RepID=A0A9Q3BDR8_9BASI|nr:hypothetical protein [Austropuccinia psidii MF-1]